MANLTSPVLLRKIIRLCRRANQWLLFARPVPDQEGRFAVVTNVGCGMRWTHGVAGRAALLRTAKSCGLGASTLASTWRWCLRITPGMVARKPDHQREHEGSRYNQS